MSQTKPRGKWLARSGQYRNGELAEGSFSRVLETEIREQGASAGGENVEALCADWQRERNTGDAWTEGQRGPAFLRKLRERSKRNSQASSVCWLVVLFCFVVQ